MRLHVRYLDGSEAEVVATASARRAFEARHQIPVMEAVGSLRSYWADELAHASLVQTTDENRELDDWLETVETIVWEAPVGKLAQLAETLGVKVTAEDVEAARPTGGAAKVPSRAGSSKRPSTRAKTSPA